FASLDARKDNTYLLPICTSLEMDGSRTASNRSLQWGEQIVKPAFESKNDYEVVYLLAQKLGYADKMFKNIKVENNAPLAEDLLREINRGGWSTGYRGQLGHRSVGRHPARLSRTWGHALRQRQSAGKRLEPARPGASASRADLHAAPGSRRQIPDQTRRAAVPHAEYRLQRAEGGGRQ